MLRPMKIKEVRKLLHAEPFRPFLVYVADGGRIPVKHEDFVALAPTGREMIVYQTDGKRIYKSLEKELEDLEDQIRRAGTGGRESRRAVLRG